MSYFSRRCRAYSVLVLRFSMLLEATISEGCLVASGPSGGTSSIKKEPCWFGLPLCPLVGLGLPWVPVMQSPWGLVGTSSI